MRATVVERRLGSPLSWGSHKINGSLDRPSDIASGGGRLLGSAVSDLIAHHNRP
jgi:hypothetical protein